VQIAILLDTSSSMDGLIAQAKSQLWKIVNEFGSARRGGSKPRLEIALYEYGKSTLASGEGFIRMILPFTTDLDRVSEELFGLSTIGGEEYCGRVIREATRSLGWSERKEDLKLIFIAGNEPFSQGDVDYHRSVREAAAKGIVVNTIYCGDPRNGEAAGWRDGAMLADGRFMSIDQDRQVVDIHAPQDDEIAKLGAALNDTYVPYGASGGASQLRQSAQDQNAKSAGIGTWVQRSVSKASSSYSNAGWDLVDAVHGKAVDLAKLDSAQLPPAMRGMTASEQQAYLEGQAKHRATLQRRIAELDQDRRAFIAKKSSERTQSDTLDGAILGAVRDEATRAGYRFE
jgi:hypothetical protein